MSGIGIGLGLWLDTGVGAPAPPVFTGPLDGLTASPVSSWSIARRLTSAYSGNLVRLRRLSDSAEMDFGFGGDNLLDVSAVNTFLTATTGVVVTVYDQVGANNLIQATAADQPAYGGTAFNAAHPGADFVSGDFMTADAIAAAVFNGDDQPYTAMATWKFDIITGNDTAWSTGSSLSGNSLDRLRATSSNWQMQRRGDTAGATVTVDTAADVNAHIFSQVFAGTTVDLFVDGGAQEQNDAAYDAIALVADQFTVGCLRRNSNTDFYDGQFSEMHVFGSAIGASDESSLRTNMVTFYGT